MDHVGTSCARMVSLSALRFCLSPLVINLWCSVTKKIKKKKFLYARQSFLWNYCIYLSMSIRISGCDLSCVFIFMFNSVCEIVCVTEQRSCLSVFKCAMKKYTEDFPEI